MAGLASISKLERPCLLHGSLASAQMASLRSCTPRGPQDRQRLFATPTALWQRNATSSNAPSPLAKARRSRRRSPRSSSSPLRSSEPVYSPTSPSTNPGNSRVTTSSPWSSTPPLTSPGSPRLGPEGSRPTPRPHPRRSGASCWLELQSPSRSDRQWHSERVPSSMLPTA